MEEILLTIPGEPIAKKRPRFFVRRNPGKGRPLGAENIQQTEEGKFISIMFSQLAGRAPITKGTPIKLGCIFYMPIPASVTKRKRAELMAGNIPHVARPDLDNLVKFVKDCSNGVLWADDSQVSYLTAAKYYSLYPRTEITIFK